MDGPIARRGLTLAEILIAIGLFAAVTLALGSLVISGLKLNRQGGEMSLATEFGREFLETVKQRGYPMISNGTFDGRLATPTPPVVATGFPPAPYPFPISPSNSKYRLVVVAGDFSPGVKSVQVDVWYAARSKIRLYTLVHQ